MKNFKLGKLPNKNNIYKIKKIAITSGIILTLTTGCGINKNKDGYYEKEVCATKVDYETINTNLDEIKNLENIEYFIIDKNNNKAIENDVQAIKKIIEQGKTRYLYIYLSYENTYHFLSKEEYINHVQEILNQLNSYGIRYILIGKEDILKSIQATEKYTISNDNKYDKRYADGKLLSKSIIKKEEYQKLSDITKGEKNKPKTEQKKEESQENKEKKKEENNKEKENKSKKEYDENGWELVNEEYYYKGIDVSEYQGKIDWKKTKEDINYAIIRVGDSYNKDKNGNIIVDQYYHRNMRKCNEYNINVGIYLYTRATTEEEIDKEIKFVYNNLTDKNGDPYNISLPIYIDIEGEVAEKLRNTNTRKKQIKHIRKFCQHFEDIGYSTGIYINSNDLYTIEELQQFTTWLSGGWLYNVENNTKKMYLRQESNINEDGELEINVSPTTYWSPAAQTNSKTKVSGINGYVDGDYAEKKSYDALIELSEKNKEKIKEYLKRNR